MSLTPNRQGRPPGAKKKKRGPTPSLTLKETGFPLSLRSMNHPEWKTYFRDKKKESRSSSSPSLPSDSPIPKCRAISTDNIENHNQPGHPPLDPEHGPMKESSIKERMRELMKSQRHKDKISMARSTTVSFCWDKTKSGTDTGKSNREGEDGDTEANETIELIHGPPSARTVRRYEAELKELVPASLQRQCELLKKMANEYDGCGVSIERNIGSQETPKTTCARYKATISKFFKNA